MKKGDIIIVYFPFTNFKSFKRRPALVLAPENKFGDVCVAFITSKIIKGKGCFLINEPDKNFRKTGLKLDATVRVDHLATIQKKFVVGKIGSLTPAMLMDLNKALKKFLYLRS